MHEDDENLQASTFSRQTTMICSGNKNKTLGKQKPKAKE
jgi:hypothetical protein